MKLEAHQLSVMDVVHAVNESNLILPAGDVRIGPKDYNIYANSQIPVVEQIDAMPIKTDKGVLPVYLPLATLAERRRRLRANSKPTSFAWMASTRCTFRC